MTASEDRARVELAAEGDEEAGQFQGLLGLHQGEFDQAALDQVALGLGLETQIVQDLLDQTGPALPAVDLGGAALELETDVIVVFGFGNIGVDDTEMVADAGVKIKIVLGDDGVTLAPQAPLRLGGVVHGVGKDRNEALEVRGHLAGPGHAGVVKAPEQGQEGAADDIGFGDLLFTCDFEAAA